MLRTRDFGDLKLGNSLAGVPSGSSVCLAIRRDQLPSFSDLLQK